EKAKEFCLENNLVVEEVYVDEGASGTDTKRSELQRLFNDIKENKIECVLVDHLDRLTRSLPDLQDMLYFFEEHNCKFKSVEGELDTADKMDRMLTNIISTIHQTEENKPDNE